MRLLHALLPSVLAVATASAQDPPELAGPPAPPPPDPADAVGIWRIDLELTGERMLQSLEGMEKEQLEANKKFYAVILEALRDSEYRLYPGGAYRAKVGSAEKSGMSRGSWTLEGDVLTLRQTHLEGKPLEEMHRARLDGDRIAFLGQGDTSGSAFVLERHPLTGPWVVDAEASAEAIERQLEGLSEAEADVRRTALESVLDSYRDARFRFRVDNTWAASLGEGERAIRLRGRWARPPERFVMQQTHRGPAEAVNRHEGVLVDDRIVFEEPSFALVLVPVEA